MDDNSRLDYSDMYETYKEEAKCSKSDLNDLLCCPFCGIKAQHVGGNYKFFRHDIDCWITIVLGSRRQTIIYKREITMWNRRASCRKVSKSDLNCLLALLEAVKEELPHMRYDIDCLHEQNFDDGSLLIIYKRLKALSERC